MGGSEDNAIAVKGVHPVYHMKEIARRMVDNISNPSFYAHVVQLAKMGVPSWEDCFRIVQGLISMEVDPSIAMQHLKCINKQNKTGQVALYFAKELTYEAWASEERRRLLLVYMHLRNENDNNRKTDSDLVGFGPDMDGDVQQMIEDVVAKLSTQKKAASYSIKTFLEKVAQQPECQEHNCVKKLSNRFVESLLHAKYTSLLVAMKGVRMETNRQLQLALELHKVKECQELFNGENEAKLARYFDKCLLYRARRGYQAEDAADNDAEFFQQSNYLWINKLCIRDSSICKQLQMETLDLYLDDIKRNVFYYIADEIIFKKMCDMDKQAVKLDDSKKKIWPNGRSANFLKSRTNLNKMVQQEIRQHIPNVEGIALGLNALYARWFDEEDGDDPEKTKLLFFQGFFNSLMCVIFDIKGKTPYKKDSPEFEGWGYARYSTTEVLSVSLALGNVVSSVHDLMSKEESAIADSQLVDSDYAKKALENICKRYSFFGNAKSMSKILQSMWKVVMYKSALDSYARHVITDHANRRVSSNMKTVQEADKRIEVLKQVRAGVKNMHAIISGIKKCVMHTDDNGSSSMRIMDSYTGLFNTISSRGANTQDGGMEFLDFLKNYKCKVLDGMKLQFKTAKVEFKKTKSALMQYIKAENRQETADMPDTAAEFFALANLNRLSNDILIQLEAHLNEMVEKRTEGAETLSEAYRSLDVDTIVNENWHEVTEADDANIQYDYIVKMHLVKQFADRRDDANTYKIRYLLQSEIMHSSEYWDPLTTASRDRVRRGGGEAGSNFMMGPYSIFHKVKLFLEFKNAHYQESRIYEHVAADVQLMCAGKSRFAAAYPGGYDAEDERAAVVQYIAEMKARREVYNSMLGSDDPQTRVLGYYIPGYDDQKIEAALSMIRGYGIPEGILKVDFNPYLHVYERYSSDFQLSMLQELQAHTSNLHDRIQKFRNNAARDDDDDDGYE
jgi:hypothetical protein